MDFEGQGLSRSPAFDRDSIDARCHDVRGTSNGDVVGIYRDLVIHVCRMSVSNESERKELDWQWEEGSQWGSRSGTSSNSYSKSRTYTTNGRESVARIASRYSSSRERGTCFAVLEGQLLPSRGSKALHPSRLRAASSRVKPHHPRAHIRTFALINFCSKHPVSCTCVTDIHRRVT